jgi:hypothetical protein
MRSFSKAVSERHHWGLGLTYGCPMKYLEISHPNMGRSQRAHEGHSTHSEESKYRKRYQRPGAFMSIPLFVEVEEYLL